MTAPPYAPGAAKTNEARHPLEPVGPRLEQCSAARVYEPGTIWALECHAATLLPLGEGDLLCAFFAGSREGHRNTAIWWSERRGGHWSEPAALPQIAPEPHWNPVLFESAGLAQLYFKVGSSPRSWDTWRCARALEGEAFGPAAELVPRDRSGRGPVKNKPILLNDGAQLAPGSVESRTRWDCFTDRSVDGGRTWQRSALVPMDHDAGRGKGIIQPTLWESTPGRVHMLTRSKNGWVYRSDSRDGGRSWSEAVPMGLPNNDSGIDVVRVGSDLLLLAHNPLGERGVRTPLCLSASTDNGESWSQVAVLEDSPGEYSYPAIIANESCVAVAYTWNRVGIAVREFRLD